MPTTYRIKVRSVEHHRECVTALKEVGVRFMCADEDELSMYRYPKRLKSAWIYVGLDRNGWTFFSKSIVKYAHKVNLKDVLRALRNE